MPCKIIFTNVSFYPVNRLSSKNGCAKTHTPTKQAFVVSQRALKLSEVSNNTSNHAFVQIIDIIDIIDIYQAVPCSDHPDGWGFRGGIPYVDIFSASPSSCLDMQSISGAFVCICISFTFYFQNASLSHQNKWRWEDDFFFLLLQLCVLTSIAVHLSSFKGQSCVPYAFF